MRGDDDLKEFDIKKQKFLEVLADYYEDHLLRAGCELSQCSREWSFR